MRRLLLKKPTALTALLAVRVKGKPLPWVSLVLADFRALKQAVASCNNLPDVEKDQAPWNELMQCDIKWRQALGCFNFVDSTFGQPQGSHSSLNAEQKLADRGQDQGAHHGGYQCNMCSAVFTTERAMQSHRRAKHQQRAEQRFYSNKEGRCQVCGTLFHTHARLLRHLTDRRRTR
eukprot:12404769-Karenia_brevis.AAC.1